MELKHAVISKEPVVIQGIDVVENAYEGILQYGKKLFILNCMY
jgi:hypothetical protein